jgi:glycosyltransferase involved in cell wall biosynthesis
MNQSEKKLPLKVLHLISSRGLYGAERVVINLTEAMDRSSVVPQVVLLRNEGYPNTEFIKAFKNTKIDVIPCKKWIDTNAIRKLNELIDEKQFDIIHCHEMKGRLYALLCSYKKSKLITTHHNWIRNNFITSLFEALDAFYIRFFYKIIAVSPEVKKMLYSIFISKEKIDVVINGINTNFFKRNEDSRNKIRNDLFIDEKVKLVGSFGRISCEKGHIYLIKSALEVLKVYPKTKFIIIGNGPKEEEIKQYVIQKEMSDSIIFLDFKENINEYYSALDIFVLPSIIEGTPMALIEAMSTGIPVIATKVGGVGHIIVDKQDGLLVQPKRIKELSDTIIELLNDTELSVSISKNGCKKVRNLYSAERMAIEYTKLYSTLML